jgi:integrase
MASIKLTRSGTFQLSIKNRLLPKTLWATFDSREQAEAYGRQLEGLLAQGIVPVSLLERSTADQEIWTLSRCIAEYIRNNSVPVSDVKLLDTVRPGLSATGTGQLNYDWAEGWIRSMKRVQNLSPSTIRHRHGALARCFDWMLRKHPEIMAQNPLRLLKRGFATYTDDDNRFVLAAGMQAKRDVERDRRLDVDEEERILSVLAANPDGKAFFILALETAMRMRECYTLDIGQINLGKRTISLDRTKNGDSRQVPLSSTAIALLRDYMDNQQAAIKARDGRLFPFWNGDVRVAALDRTTSELSRLFRMVFLSAKVEGVHFHDIRHEATCRLYEKTTLSDVLIAKITGHRSLRMLQRYASLRGSDLAPHLW